MIREGKVMSVEEMKEAGIELPPGHEETWQTSHGPITVCIQEPESGEGTYNPNAPEGRKVIPFHRGEQKKAA